MICVNRMSLFLLMLLVLPFMVQMSCSRYEGPNDNASEIYTCTGTPSACLRVSNGWTYEGVVLSLGQTGNGGSDPFVLRLDDGRYRIYYAVADSSDPDWWGMVSWVSDDGLSFTKETGCRFEGYTLFGHWIVRNPDGSYRMYWLDQKQGYVNNLGCKAIKSALSTDGGWTFVGDQGERLTYSGTGYEGNGIGVGRVILLGDGTFRMFYSGISDYARTLSAVSSDGLSFTREAGTRLDKLCPPEGGAPMVTPIIDALGTVHLFLWGTRCIGNYEDSQSGLFDGTTPDGLTITIASSPFVQGYSQDGTMNTWVPPEDFTVVQTRRGLRLYFILYGNRSAIIPETALYSVINTSIK